MDLILTNQFAHLWLQVPGMLYYGYVTPFVNMSIQGFLWYQGENNCNMDVIGNYKDGTGYGCELPAMVADWRAAFSATPGTTDPLAPFGVATLAAGGSEGNGGHMSAMRWAEQGNYGHWDSPAMPNSFGAQLYDLGDPWRGRFGFPFPEFRISDVECAPDFCMFQSKLLKLSCFQ